MAGALVGGAFLSAFLQVAFDRLASPKILDYFQVRKLNASLLKKLEITLISINAVIDDAEEKQIRNPNVKRWVDELKEAVFAAEDLLDEIETEISIQELEAELHDTSSKVPNLSTAMASASVNLFDKEIESRIERVLGDLKHLAKQKDVLGLMKDGFGVGGKQSQRVPSTSLVDDTRVCGRNEDKEAIMKLLLSDNGNGSCLSVVSIVAMGGMGKTTLAQLVYNDGRVTDHFDIKSWIYVSDEFDVINLTKKFLQALVVPAHDSEDLNILQLKLKEKLIDKKFLLVLDDVWDEKSDTWERLLLPLIHGTPGSKVLATTRSERVAEVMHSISKHPLRQLGGEEGWELFCRHAFDGRDSDVNPDLEAIGRKIVDKCQGLPLAIKTLGGLLRTKYEEKEWNMILRSNIWDFNDAESNIIPALRLSYHYLPSHLKRCFSYCSIFPKGSIFSENKLILFWMAEGLLQHSKQNKRMEEVGEEYFRDLVARSFFQKLHSDFVMHDLIIDLATSISGEFCYKLEKDIKNIPKRTRHLWISTHIFDTWTIFDASHNYQYSNLRTFMLQGWGKRNSRLISQANKLLHDLTPRLKHLRVLSLLGSIATELSDSIGNLTQLRYLDLSFTMIEKLPDSICKLYNLQTFMLVFCENFLGELPKDMHKLVNLRHFDFDCTYIKETPLHLRRLKHLRTLTCFEVGKCSGSDVKQLGQLNQLGGSLTIAGLQNVIDPTDGIEANLKEKEYIEELRLEWSRKDEDDEDSIQDRSVLESLQPHKKLKKLSVFNYVGTRFPEWVGDCYNSLPRIVSLELGNCKYCLSVPPLGQLPFLKQLGMYGLDALKTIGPEFYFYSRSDDSLSNSVTPQPFRSLEILRIEDMKSWEEWCCFIEGGNEAAVGFFPCLKELVIGNCPRLKQHLPPQLPSLEKLQIHGCQQLVASLPRAPNMVRLELKECEEMSLIDVPSFPILGEVSIDGCNSLSSLSLDLFPMLSRLELINCQNFEFLLSDSSVSSESGSERQRYSTPSLSMLKIGRCPKFVSFSQELRGLSFKFNAPKLHRLVLVQLENLKSLPEDVPNLISLEIMMCPKIVVESFPEEGLLPINLMLLNLGGYPNIRTVNYRALLHLKSLTYLAICDCPNFSFECLSDEEGLPKSLSNLYISGNCPLLKQRCQKENGQDWHKIAHISYITVNGIEITERP